MEKNLDILWIIPHLNEDLRVVDKNISQISSFSQSNNFKHLIAIVDGGSREETIIGLNDLIKHKKDTSLSLVLPTLRPTKNKGIKDMVNKFDAKYIAIVDSDCLNLSNDVLSKLIMPLINEKYDVSIPDITKKGGRVNRLICIPLLSILFDKVASKVSYPLSGIIALKKDILREIVNKEDYFWDWGGEIQIIIQASQKNKVKQFHFNKLDAKKRSMESKREDIRQLMRTIFYEAIKEKKISRFKEVKKSVIEKYKNAENYEHYIVKKLVLTTIGEILFGKTLDNKKLENVTSRKIDFLSFTDLEEDLKEIYKYYINEFVQGTNITNFLNECKKLINIQKKFYDIDSINLKNFSNEKLTQISKIYNSTMSDENKVKEILSKNDNWKN